MKFTHNEAAILPYNPLYPLTHIEICGRTCYNSLDKMGKGTAEKFVQNLINSQHYAMLEHANFVFQVTEELYVRLHAMNETCSMESNDQYLSWGARHLSFTRSFIESQQETRFLVSGNVRAINNTKCGDLLLALYKICPTLVYAHVPYFNTQMYSTVVHIPDIFQLPELHEEEVRAHCYITFRNDTDRGVTHEMVRHREASYAQESTRYCNYSNNKYGGELTFVIPSTFDQWSEEAQRHFRNTCQMLEAEYNYLNTIERLTPQQSRVILPNGLKSTIIMTTNVDEYIHFFNLRYKGITGAPHPDMKDLAEKMYDEYVRFFNMKGFRQFDDIML